MALLEKMEVFETKLLSQAINQGFTYASKDEVKIGGPLRQQMRSVLGNHRWYICKLANNCSIGGPGHAFDIKEGVTETLGHALMVKYKVTSNQSSIGNLSKTTNIAQSNESNKSGNFDLMFVAELTLVETKFLSKAFDQGFTLATKYEVNSGGSLGLQMRSVLDNCRWHICKLDNNCSIGGPGYNYDIKEGVTDALGHALMVRYYLKPNQSSTETNSITQGNESFDSNKTFVAEMNIFETSFQSQASDQGFRLATKDQVKTGGPLRQNMSSVLESHTWHICKLANNCSIGGPGYKYEIKGRVTEQLGHALMVKYKPNPVQSGMEASHMPTDTTAALIAMDNFEETEHTTPSNESQAENSKESTSSGTNKNEKKQKPSLADLEAPECPICFDPFLVSGKIFQCSQGHLICQNCFERPEISSCPTCRQQFMGRAFGMEHFIQQIFK